MKTAVIPILLVVLAGAAAFRLWRLADRPMHADEAVHAEKFGALLEKGLYCYDPDEFHGPTLNYFTLLSAWLRGEHTYENISEVTLRLVPAVFGIALILTPLFFVQGLGWRAAFFGCILLAFSPLFIYYSRYYIQEILLLFFSAVFLGAVWRYLHCQKLYWVILAGVALGLMHTTKETFVFAAGAGACAVLYTIWTGTGRCKGWHLLAGFCTAAAISTMFYSSFGSNWQGIGDSFAAYAGWFQRAGSSSVHSHPWYYYLDLLTWIEFLEPITWNEDGIAALGLIGAAAVFFQNNSLHVQAARFVAIYTLFLTVVYCAIPYKTPWNMMGFVYGLALLAGFTADRLLDAVQGCWSKFVFWTLLGLYGLASPVVQSWFLNFRYASDPINPYVYAHTSKDVFEMVRQVQTAADTQTPISVIAAGDDYWPLPWYLRSFSKVGYWNHPDPSVCDVPLILAQARHEQELLNLLYSVPPAGQRHLYLPLFDKACWLRPGVEWRGYIRKDQWDKMFSVSPILSDTSEEPMLMQSRPDKTQIANLLKFSHQAMNTTFEIFIQHTDGTYAGRAARAAFREIDRLEAQLSRFVENSDISRINRLQPGQTAAVDEDTLNCLAAAKQAWELTGGAFDVTIGRMIEVWKKQDSQQAAELLRQRPSMAMLELHPQTCSVGLLGEGVYIDLGGIGKGYAVDAAGRILKEWGISRSFIQAGTSSALALDAPQGQSGWKVTLTNPADETIVARLAMANEALSCSGLLRGSHIINPFTGQPVADRRACWIRLGPNAALADALSTAAMILPIEKLKALYETVDGISIMAVLIEPNGRTELLQLGQWPKD